MHVVFATPRSREVSAMGRKLDGRLLKLARDSENTIEAAAEAVGLPVGTFRHRLKAAEHDRDTGQRARPL